MAQNNKGAAANEVAVQKQGGAVAVSHDYGDMAGAGFEGTTSKDLAIPFLEIMQSNSPEVEAGSMKLGQIFNSVTGEVIEGETGVPLIPVHTEVSFNEWVPREKGGGLVARYQPSDEIVQKALAARGDQMGKMTLPNGNDLVETHYLYVLTLDDEGSSVTGFALISCTSTKITPLRKFKTALYMLKGKPPIFANRARLVAFRDKNTKGTFANIKFDPLRGDWAKSLINPAAERALLDEAVHFRDMILSGIAKPVEEKQDTSSASSQPERPAQGERRGAGGGDAGGKSPF